MEAKDKKLIEKLESDFHTLSEKNAWTPEDLEKMKNLQKLMYYMEVRCAMKEGQEYPGSEYMDERSYDGRSYARSMPNRSPSTGRFTSGRSYDGGYNVGNSYGMSGRHYYDDDKMHAVNDLRRMHQNEQNPEVKMAIERAINDLEMR